MRTLYRNRRPVYVCKRYTENNIVKYEEPKQVRINFQYTNSDSDLIALGLDYPIYMRIKGDLSDLKYFHAHDRVYVWNKPNTPFDVLAKDADYEVESDPIISLNSIEVSLKKLSGKKYGN